MKIGIFKTLITSIICYLFYITFFASNIYADERIDNQEDIAEVLKEANLFLGTSSGYELDREPTRVEGSVMLIRMLGKEKEILQGKYYHPFDDVPKWATNYIGYLYENKLTQGISSKKFGSDIKLSSTQYLTFVLRSLGYVSDKDFDLNNVLDFALKSGVIDALQVSEYKSSKITRGGCADITYSALLAKYKGTSKTLLKRLVENKSITKNSEEKIITEQTEFTNNDQIASVLLENKGKVLSSSSEYTHEDFYAYTKSYAGFKEGIVVFNSATQIKTELIGFQSENIYIDDKYLYISIDYSTPNAYILVLDKNTFSTVTKLNLDAWKFLTINGYFCYIDGHLNLHYINNFDFTTDTVLLSNVFDIKVYQNRLYAISDGILFGFNQMSSFKILDDILEFEIVGDELYYTTKQVSNNNKLIKMNIKTGDKKELTHNVDTFSIVEDHIYFCKISDQTKDSLIEIYPPLYSMNREGEDILVELNEPVMKIQGDGRYLSVFNTEYFNRFTHRITYSIYDTQTKSLYLSYKDDFYSSAMTNTIIVDNSIDEKSIFTLEEIKNSFFECPSLGNDNFYVNYDPNLLLEQIPNATYINYVTIPNDGEIYIYEYYDKFRYAVDSNTFSSFNNDFNISEFTSIKQKKPNTVTITDTTTLYLVIFDSVGKPIAYYKVNDGDKVKKQEYWKNYTITLNEDLSNEEIKDISHKLYTDFSYKLEYKNLTCENNRIQRMSSKENLFYIEIFVGHDGNVIFNYDAETLGIMSIE